MQSTIKLGSLVSSLKGHDKNRLYIVVKVDENFAHCADGVYHLLSKPKKKRLKHLQDLFEAFDFIEEKLKENKLYDFKIKTLIKNKSKMHKN